MDGPYQTPPSVIFLGLVELGLWIAGLVACVFAVLWVVTWPESRARVREIDAIAENLQRLIDAEQAKVRRRLAEAERADV